MDAARPAAAADRRDLRLLAAFVGLATLGLWLWGPIAQSQAYHRFADTRALFGVANGADVLSNAAFALVGAAGLWTLARGRAVLRSTWESAAWICVFTGVLATAVGSAWYHAAPDDAGLAWDRLPMTVVFTAFLAVQLGERVAPRLGRAALVPLVLAGAGSVVLWRTTGDLRAYAAVQFVPLPVLAYLLVRRRGCYDRTADVVWVLAWYAAAKALEALDVVVWELGLGVSGHTLKHLAAACGAACLVVHVRRRREIPGAATIG